jgi:hypothetical protein
MKCEAHRLVETFDLRSIIRAGGPVRCAGKGEAPFEAEHRSFRKALTAGQADQEPLGRTSQNERGNAVRRAVLGDSHNF